MDLFKCKNCNNIIKSKNKLKFHFIKCEHCGKEYQLDTKCYGIYNLLPFITVFICVVISAFIIKSDDIFIKCIIIIGGSFALYRLFCLLFIKKGKMVYHEYIKEGKK